MRLRTEPLDTAYLKVWIWHCGDACQCSEPRIEIVLPPGASGRPWFDGKVLWKGSWACESTRQELAQQLRETRTAARKLGIPLRGRMMEPYVEYIATVPEHLR